MGPRAASPIPSTPDDLDLIADPRVALRNRARWKLQHAPRICNHTRDSPGLKVFLQMNHRLVPVEKNDVNPELHPKSMNAVRRNNPKTAGRVSPGGRLSKQAHQPGQECIRHRRVCREQDFSCSVAQRHVSRLRGRLVPRRRCAGAIRAA